MMKSLRMNLRSWLMSFVIIASVGGSMLAVVAPQTASAALDDSCNNNGKSWFMGFPAWYRGLTDSDCNILNPNDAKVGGLSNFIWRVALNLLEITVVAATYLSAFYFLFGGWMFIISQGKPEGAAKARSIMTMAALGLILLLSAIVFINFIFDRIINI
jgi:hypothetical protein